MTKFYTDYYLVLWIGQALSSTLEELGDAYISKDGKLVLDFLEAIHAAETRQAELDARMYAAEKKSLKV